MSWDRIWLLEAPAGVPSSGPSVLWIEPDLDSDSVLSSLVDKGCKLTGPYVLAGDSLDTAPTLP